MKKILIIMLFSMSAYAETAHLVDEQVIGGNRLCYYDSVSKGTFVITIDANSFCAFTVEV